MRKFEYYLSRLIQDWGLGFMVVVASMLIFGLVVFTVIIASSIAQHFS